MPVSRRCSGVNCNPHIAAGCTISDSNPPRLAARVANITGRGSGPRANGDNFLTLAGLTDDGRWDYLSGGAGEDLYFVINRFDLVLTATTGDTVEAP